jgi:hypothetical protein
VDTGFRRYDKQSVGTGSIWRGSRRQASIPLRNSARDLGRCRARGTVVRVQSLQANNCAARRAWTDGNMSYG